jgi:hypothetical protein
MKVAIQHLETTCWRDDGTMANQSLKDNLKEAGFAEDTPLDHYEFKVVPSPGSLDTPFMIVPYLEKTPDTDPYFIQKVLHWMVEYSWELYDTESISSQVDISLHVTEQEFHEEIEFFVEITYSPPIDETSEGQPPPPREHVPLRELSIRIKAADYQDDAVSLAVINFHRQCITSEYPQTTPIILHEDLTWETRAPFILTKVNGNFAQFKITTDDLIKIGVALSSDNPCLWKFPSYILGTRRYQRPSDDKVVYSLSTSEIYFKGIANHVCTICLGLNPECPRLSEDTLLGRFKTKCSFYLLCKACHRPWQSTASTYWEHIQGSKLVPMCTVIKKAIQKDPAIMPIIPVANEKKRQLTTWVAASDLDGQAIANELAQFTAGQGASSAQEHVNKKQAEKRAMMQANRAAKAEQLRAKMRNNNKPAKHRDEPDFTDL